MLNGGGDIGKSKYSSSKKKKVFLLIQELLVASLLRYYGDKYFSEPIENLAMSIVASCLVNDPKDALSVATTCSIMYALSTQWIQKLMMILDIKNTFIGFPARPSSARLIEKYPQLMHKLPAIFEVLSFSSKYIRYASYLASFHVVVSQIKQNLIVQSYERKSESINSSNSSNNNNNSSNGSTNGAETPGAAATSGANNSGENGANGSPALTPVKDTSTSNSNTNAGNGSGIQAASMTQAASISSIVSNGAAGSAATGTVSGGATTPGGTPMNGSVFLQPLPIYSSLVKDSSVNDISITSPSASNNQTWVPNITTAFSTDHNPDHRNDLSNQVYSLELNLDSQENCPNLSTISTVNLQNFVRQLFRWKNHHIIPPIWAIFTATQTLISEKNNIKVSNDNVAPLTTTVAVDDDKIGPTAGNNNETSANSELSPVSSGSNGNGNGNGNGNANGVGQAQGKGVFSSKSISDSMTLIAPAMDDYHKLNLVSTEFKNDYRVCITFIGSNSITFRIDSLFEGELIVLVNGVIWSQVGSAIVPSVPGQEYTIVSGLVPLCSYDIQFINRLNELEDYLIADLMVRTIGKSGDQEALDLSFPSYYHRKFLSPILTLQHSILTTNANLAEERAKLKKTRREVTKKLNTMKQDIETFKSKLEFNVTQDEKSASKVENLKMALKQGENQTAQLENKLKQLTQEESELEEVYLIEKDRHFQRTLECSKAEDQWKMKVKETESQLNKLKQELQQLQVKKSKSVNKHVKLQKEVDQMNDDFHKYSAAFLEKRNKERVERNQLRSREATDLELRIKGLEQDISRLEGEANQLHQIIQNGAF